MKRVIVGILLILFVGCLSGKKATQKREEDLKDYQKLKDEFKLLTPLMNIGNNDTICDIAGGFGVSSSALATYLPSSTVFYEEDINKKDCSKYMFKNVFKYFKSNANIDNYRFSIGKKDVIPYPAKSFNNITLFISIHEFEYKEKMLNEVHRILRDTGKLYLLETVYKDTLVKDENCGFHYLSQDNLYALIDMANFKIVYDTTLWKETETDNSFAKFLICTKK